jgi:hypothetical protein
MDMIFENFSETCKNILTHIIVYDIIIRDVKRGRHYG